MLAIFIVINNLIETSKGGRPVADAPENGSAQRWSSFGDKNDGFQKMWPNNGYSFFI